MKKKKKYIFFSTQNTLSYPSSMSMLDSFISKRKQNTDYKKTENSVAFIAPTDLHPTKQSVIVNEKIMNSKVTTKKKKNASKKQNNTIKKYFSSCPNQATEEIKEEEVILYITRKSIPLMNAWNDLLKEYTEEEEEITLYTVRKTEPISNIWKDILKELSEEGPNKRKNEQDKEGLKKQKIFIDESRKPIRHKLSSEESINYLSAILYEYSQ